MGYFGICCMHLDDATMEDATGRPWCERCKNRCALINYGHAHHWPLVSVQHYAIGNDQNLWELAALIGHDEAVETLLNGLTGTNDYEEAS
ncbi:MAG TPA: hypothetical protein VII61_23170 [Ktedonobacteraceae bacterium]